VTRINEEVQNMLQYKMYQQWTNMAI